MTRYDFTEKAADDVEAIFSYTMEKWGIEQARRYIRSLYECCDRIVSGTVVTRPFPENADTRSHHCQHHYLFFRIHDDGIIILAVLHERMDFIARLKDRL